MEPVFVVPDPVAVGVSAEAAQCPGYRCVSELAVDEGGGMAPFVDSPQSDSVPLSAVQMLQHVRVIRSTGPIEVELSQVGVNAVASRPVSP